MGQLIYPSSVNKWGVFEVRCKGKTEGNPFVDYQIKGHFISKNETVVVDGFYDGEGIYRVRFMPSFMEDYSFEIEGNFSDKIYHGQFKVTKPKPGHHGPVRVVETYHLAYEDGTPYFSIGTTCYVWALQDEDVQEKTLKTLASSAFNKIRFCIFPKHYNYNFKEPISYPYEGTPMDSSVITKDNFGSFNAKSKGNHWDFKRFNVKHFQHLEKCIEKLGDLGIEADLIVMHPYDRWGFSAMSAEEDDLYWKYVIARFAAYHNVWWSLANEYDLLEEKKLTDWERYARIICEKDPYGHLRSVHNCGGFYDFTRPWVTHCSIQRQDLYRTAEYVQEWRERYRKPVILDEISYEGNLSDAWGNISGQELVRRFWEATCRGGYAGHGETYLSEDEIIWWSHGGTLKGESPARLQFLSKIMKEIPGVGLAPISLTWDAVCATLDGLSQSFKAVKDYYLIYYSIFRPSFKDFYFDEETEFKVEVIDTWNMTIEDRGVHKGKFKVILPGREYMAIRLTKVF